MPDITPEESFLIQAYALVECYVHLGELEIGKDPLIFANIDKIYGQTGKMMAAHEKPVFKGTLISVFYMLLVLPYEWAKSGIGEFKKLDLSDPERVANGKAKVTTNTYPKKDQALRHFRNALAHGRIGWSTDGALIINDIYARNGHSYTAEYSMRDLGELAQSLNMAIAKHIETVIKPRKKNA